MKLITSMIRNFKKIIWWAIHVSIRHSILSLRIFFLRKFYNMNIGRGVKISLSAKLDKTNPKGIYIDNYTYIAFETAILTHDMSRNIHKDTYIGKSCFIGARSIVLPGVKIGDNVVIAAGSVVTKDVPSNSLYAGNPAKFVRNIDTKKLGIIVPYQKRDT